MRKRFGYCSRARCAFFESKFTQNNWTPKKQKQNNGNVRRAFFEGEFRVCKKSIGKLQICPLKKYPWEPFWKLWKLLVILPIFFQRTNLRLWWLYSQLSFPQQYMICPTISRILGFMALSSIGFKTKQTDVFYEKTWVFIPLCILTLKTLPQYS